MEVALDHGASSGGASFCAASAGAAAVTKGVPAFSVFTGMHPDYHRPSDTADQVNVPGLLTIVDVGEGVFRAAASRSLLP